VQEIERLNVVAETTKANLVDQAQKDVDREQALYEEEIARRTAMVSTAEIEVEKLTGVYRSHQERAERVAELYEMGAAVKSDVESTRNVAQVAYHNLQQAQQSLTAAWDQVEVSDARLEKTKLEFIRLVDGDVSDHTALERGRVEIAVAQLVPDDLSVEALFDSVVLGVGAVEGSRVELGRVVAHLAARDSIWVEAYVPEKHARHVRPGGAVTVRLPGVEMDLPGTIVNESGTAVRLPELLRDDLPGMQTGVYARVNVELPAEVSIVPGGQVEVIIPTGEESPLSGLFGN